MRDPADLLAACHDIAASTADPTGTPTSRFAFVQTGLLALDGIRSNSVDVATTRSVLIYIDDIARQERRLATVHLSAMRN